jgi:ankyrin repeat protein
MHAAVQGHAHVVELLIAGGTDLAARTTKEG